MTSKILPCRSHSTEHFQSSKICLPIPTLRSSHSTSMIDPQFSLSSSSSSSSSSSFSLNNERDNNNIICSSSLSTHEKHVNYFHKSSSLDSGYKTLSAASHGTSHTDPIDEENEHHENFLHIASSPSSCSSSSYVVSNTIHNHNQKRPSKVDFIVDGDDEVQEKQVRLTRQDSKSNADGKRRHE
jgi:hypothetical protein